MKLPRFRSSQASQVTAVGSCANGPSAVLSGRPRVLRSIKCD
jgi:hypothetical protein